MVLLVNQSRCVFEPAKRSHKVDMKRHQRRMRHWEDVSVYSGAVCQSRCVLESVKRSYKVDILDIDL